MALEKERVIRTVEQRIDHYLKLAKRMNRHCSRGTIHDFRIASRNLLVITPLLANTLSPSWNKVVKQRLNALGPMRDLQVLKKRLDGSNDAVCLELEKSIDHAFNHWRRKHRKVLPKLPREQLEKARRRAVRRIEKSPGQFEQIIRNRWQAITKKLIARLEQVDTAHPKSLHKLRIAYKSFRYMAIFLHEIGMLDSLEKKSLKHWQVLLGEIQDDEVAVTWLRQNCPQERELIASFHRHSEALREQFGIEKAKFHHFVTILAGSH